MTVRKKRWQCATCKHGWFRRYRDSDVMGIYGCLLPKPGQFTGYAMNTRLPCRDFEPVISFLKEAGRRLGIQRGATAPVPATATEPVPEPAQGRKCR